jgi:hypothetical protein
MDQLMASFDPEFGEKTCGVIGFFLDPPQCAAVFITRKDAANSGESRGFHHRHAFQDLDSALVGWKAVNRHPRVGFTDLLSPLVRKLGWAPEIHVIHHNLERETDALGRCLDTRARLWSYSVSKYTTWLDLVQFWFTKGERDKLENETFALPPKSVREVQKNIRRYCKSARHFHWISSHWVEALSEPQVRRESLLISERRITTQANEEGFTLVRLSQRDLEIVKMKIEGQGNLAPKEIVGQPPATTYARLRSVYAGLGLPGHGLVLWILQHYSDLAGWIPRALHDNHPNCSCMFCQGHTRRGSKFQFKPVAVAADGKRAVSASGDRTLTAWSLNTGRALSTLEDSLYIGTVTMTPNGKGAASASSRRLRVWDLDTGRALRSLRRPDSEDFSDFDGVAITPDGKRAVSKSAHYTLAVWDLDTGRVLLTLKGHTATVYDVVVTADGKRAVSTSGDHTLKVWNLNTGRALRTLKGHTASVDGVAVTADGRRAVSTSGDHTAKVWDLDTGRALRTLKGHAYLSCVAITPNGKRAVTASLGNTLEVWDLERGILLATSYRDAPVASCAFVDERRIVVGDRGGFSILILEEPVYSEGQAET